MKIEDEWLVHLDEFIRTTCLRHVPIVGREAVDAFGLHCRLPFFAYTIVQFVLVVTHCHQCALAVVEEWTFDCQWSVFVVEFFTQ